MFFFFLFFGLLFGGWGLCGRIFKEWFGVFCSSSDFNTVIVACK